MHYHGTPITPRAVLLTLAGRCFCVSFERPEDVEVCHRIGQSVVLDCGAFTAWRQGRAAPEWSDYYRWCERWLEYPTTWAVIPDVIDGDAAANDALLEQWPHGTKGAPVWHMHEPIARLVALAERWPRVCLGGSHEYPAVGSPSWHRRMREAMDALCGNGPVPVWLHALRGLALGGSEYPFASADSTNIARNHHNGKHARAMADRIDGRQCPARWRVWGHEQLALGAVPA